MPTTTQLTPLLRELDEALDATGAPFLRHARPGLNDHDIDVALRAAGIEGRLPTEMREWWRWHNGSIDTRGPWHVIGPGFWTALSIDDALADRAEWTAFLPPEVAWEPAAIPIAGADNERLVVRLDQSTDDLATIGLWGIGSAPPFRTVASSLAEVVSQWLRALRTHKTWWDADNDGWDWIQIDTSRPPYA